MSKLTLLLIGLCVTCQASAAQTTIAVATNFSDVTRKLVPVFEQATGHHVKVSFGSTGKLYAQIKHGAPFDLFLAADIQRPAKAEDEDLAVKGTRFTYARGKLVLWSATAGRFGDGEAYLKQGEFRRAALANPKTAPYGLAAQQVLQHLGVWEALGPKLVRGDSIAQTFQFVASANAQVGFVALSQVNAWRGEAGSFWAIPQHYYGAIAQQAVLLKRGADNPAARRFLEFLQGAEAQSLIAGYGYAIE